MIDFLDDMALTTEDLHRQTEFLIDDFLPKRMITMYYAKGGNAKTWLSYGVAAHLCKHELQKRVYYIDLDNPRDALKDRDADRLLIERFPNLKYIHRSKLNENPIELLERLADKKNSKNYAYEDMTLIVDSIRNITDVRSDQKAMYMMDLLMDIRDAGMTILLIAHANKDGKNYEGSNNIYNSLDIMFKECLLRSEKDVSVTVALTTEKERAGVKDCDYTIDINNLALTKAKDIYTHMTESEIEFVNKIQEVLKEHKEGIKQGKLLEAIGSSSADKTTKAMLDKFIDKFYIYEENGNSKLFKSK